MFLFSRFGVWFVCGGGKVVGVDDAMSSLDLSVVQQEIG